MKLKDLTIRTKLKIGFLAMVCMTLTVGVFSLRQMEMLAEATDQLYRHPFTVSTAMLDLKRALFSIKASLHELDAHVPPEKVLALKQAIEVDDARVQELFAVVNARFLGDKRDVAAAQQAYLRSLPLIAETFDALAGRRDPEALEAARAAALGQLRQTILTSRVMVDFAANKAREFLTQAERDRAQAYWLVFALVILTAVLGLVLAVVSTNGIAAPLTDVVRRIRAIAEGDLGQDIQDARGDEIGALLESFRAMRASLKNKIELAGEIAAGAYGRQGQIAGENDVLGKALNEMSRTLADVEQKRSTATWLINGQGLLNARLVGEQSVNDLGREILAFLAPYMDVQIASLHTLTPQGALKMVGGYAMDGSQPMEREISLGEGLLGQAALSGEIIVVRDVPKEYFRINSSFGDARPQNIVVLPFRHDGRVAGVLELGSFTPLDAVKIEFLKSVTWAVGVAIHTAENRARLRDLLEQTRLQADRLLIQQEELRATNEELQQQSSALRASEEELRQQQDELQAINEELEEKNEYLEKNKQEMALKNVELEDIHRGLEHKARELELSSCYKSEFLANMSHELRTPLNSLLLLSRSLADNQSGNLTPDQVEYAKVIHKSGNDLLALINDILDLSKIEAGKMIISPEPVQPAELLETVGLFKPMCMEKGLTLTGDATSGLPEAIRTDRQRVEQILRNLLSNAVKFTEKGAVEVRIDRPAPGTNLSRSGLSPDATLAISVKDSGIGIPQDKQLAVFEAFQQADGGTSRKYGGTGLGLSISREMARLLGGEIQLESSPGQGSTFTLFLPFALPGANEEAAAHPGLATPVPGRKLHILPSATQMTPDDRDALAEGDRAILIIEDDPAFAKVLLDQCRAKGLRALVAGNGEEGLLLASGHQPAAIILDIKLPGMDGWQVLEALKSDPELRHIPVHVMSALDGAPDALRKGAVGFLSKPARREDLEQVFHSLEGFMEKGIKDLLIIEDIPEMRTAIISLVGDMDVRIHQAATGAEAIATLSSHRVDCVILDLGLPDMSGFELLSRLEKESQTPLPPIIVYTGRDMTKDEERELRALADSIIIKGVKSEERLLDETALFLHQMVKRLPRKKIETIVGLHDRDASLRGRTVLLVDDDMRNLFALSQVLQQRGVNVLKAEDGQHALDVLEQKPDLDMIILDVMMPVLDGYETARRIRGQKRFENLPIIALTAKAMREDREKCIAAGASDYLAKPVDIDRLLSMMRVWLHR